MHYSGIEFCDIANGEGVRTSLFVSGCTHHCKNCFNPETWDFNYGKPFTQDTVNEILDSLSHEYTAGLTLLGGDPLEPRNQETVLSLVKQIKEKYPSKNIWCYTGFTYETDLLAQNGQAHTSFTDELLSLMDVLVDGEFIEAEKDITLKFRGSRNQRIIDLQKGTIRK